MPLQTGTHIGVYEVTGKLGEGGMGEVYRARDTSLDRDVALKVLSEAFTADPDRLARFQREAKVLASLNHPNIGGIHGLESAGDTQALVLELIEGPTLADRIAQGPISVEDTLEIATQMAEALEVAHEQGIVHRDLKPANVKVRTDGTVKVLDFGLAKAVTAEPTGSSGSNAPTLSMTGATQMGMVVGTAAYMSPEQAKGKPVDKRADVWAFGAVLYEMLTGQKAFPGDDVSDTFAMVLKFEPEWDKLPDEVPPGLRRLMERCLVKDPKFRLREVGSAIVEIHELETDSSLSESQESPSTGRLNTLTGTAAVIAAVLISAVATWYLVTPASESSAPSNRFAVNLPASVAFSNATMVPVAITPDGRRLVFNGSAAGEAQIYSRSLNELDPVPVRGADGSNGSLFLSPDGEWVGFNDTSDNTFKRVRVTGGPPVTICETGLSGAGYGGASWGSNGTIVFATAASPGLMIVPDVGGIPEPLTEPADGEEHRFPHFLPDGHALLFEVIRTGEERQIAVLDLDSGEIRTFMDGSGPQFVRSGHLLFARENAAWAVTFDSDSLELTGDAVPVLERVRMAGGRPQFTVSNDGTLVYVANTGQQGLELVWVDREGREEPIPGIPIGRYFQVELAPDGRSFALDSADENIWIYNVGRETFTPLTTGSEQNSFPVWSMDGERITFSSNRTGVPTIFERASDGTGQAEELFVLEDALGVAPVSWSPDGSTLFFDEFRNGDFNVLSLENDGEAGVIQTDARERHAVLSPNGDWIAYQSDVSRRNEVYVQRYPELGGRRQISINGAVLPRWSSDGSELFYMSGDGRQVFAVRVEADAEEPWGTPRILFEGGYIPSIFRGRSYDVAPDGRFVAIKPANNQDGGTTSETADLVVVQNWFTELTELVPVAQ